MTMVNSTALYSALYRVLHCSYRLLWWWSTGDSQHQQPISYVPNSHRHIYSLSFSPRLSLHNPVHYFWQLLPLSLPRPRFHLLVLPGLSSHPFVESFYIFFSRNFFYHYKKNLFAPSSRFLSRSVGDYKYPAKETFWKTNQICRNHFSSSWQKSNWSQCDWSWKSIKWSLYNKQVGLKVLTEIVQKQKLISNFTKC